MSTTLSIMQPYLFPYIGYFQLMSCVETFVLYDDVAFSNRSWVNGNSLLLNGKAHRFTLPLRRRRQSTQIKDLRLSNSDAWRARFSQTIRHAYSRAPFFEETNSLLLRILQCKSEFLIDLINLSLEEIKIALKLEVKILRSSNLQFDRHLAGQKRILEICRSSNATRYINPISGESLYSTDDFSRCGIDLGFIRSKAPAYKQFGEGFVPNLSIIDVLMFNGHSSRTRLLNQFDLISS